MLQARDLKRIDIFCDRYFHNSLKERTRKAHGHGTRKIFDDETQFPEKMREDFLKHSKKNNA